MKSYEEMDHHPDSEKLVQILMAKTQNEDALFFRVMVAYYWAMVASMMRTTVTSSNRGTIPVNLYAFNLAPSGSGKTLSTNVIEDEVLEQFRYNFTENTFPLLAKRNIPKIAQRRAIRWATDPDDEETRAAREFETSGPLLFSFDSATVPAIKQARHKLLMANAGSLNLMIDEIGSNLTNTKEAFEAFLELFDVGKIKQKLVKNTADNARSEEIVGKTPANLMAFGVPNALLNGAKTEEEFYDLLATGLARRCFFGYHRFHRRLDGKMTAVEMFAQQTAGGTDQFIEDLSDHLGDLADMVNANKDIEIEDPIALLFLEYQLDCETKSEKYPEHEELRRAELCHRHFKAIKLAGAYAFIDGSPIVTEDHAYMAIKLAEESGHAFDQLLTRDRPYVKLAKYISAISRPVTQADLVEDLPFYKGTNSQRQDMLNLAIAWGYQNNIVVKKQFNDGVEFLNGETLEETNLDELIVSWSHDMSRDYVADNKACWDQLHKMTNADGIHFAVHHFNNGHRCKDEVIPGFNLVVLDIDSGVPMITAQSLLKDYKALFYTTTNHQKEKNGVVCDRYRIILPTNYKLKLEPEEYKKFMVNLFTWLPFEVDEATKDIARKWVSSPSDEYIYQDGELLDVLPFIPATSKNEEFKKRNLDVQGLNNLERWILNNSGDGNRNVMLHRFAMILVDAGYGYEDIRLKVNELNAKMPDKLEEEEIMATVMVTISKELSSRASQEVAAA